MLGGIVMKIVYAAGFLIIVIVSFLAASGVPPADAPELTYAERVEVFADWATIILLAVAVCTVGYAAHEVSASQDANRLAYLQSCAAFLMGLDDRWHSAGLLKARTMIAKFRDEIIDSISSQHPRLDDKRRKDQIGKAFAVKLADLRENAIGDYVTIMEYCGFLETVGLMVKRKYVDIEDIDSLFRGPILGIEFYFSTHIADRQKETGVPTGLYENALFLAEQVKKRVI